MDVLQEERNAEVTGLGSALDELWLAERQNVTRGGVSRVLTLNLLCVTEAARLPELRAAVGRLLVRHPCRAFVVALEDGGELRSTVGSRVRAQSWGCQLVLEMVTLHTPRADFAKVPGLVRPLLVSDVPTQLFWDAPFPHDPWDLSILGELVDRTIADSSRFADPVADRRRLAALRGRKIIDLNWFRTSPWRRSLAEAFEHFTWRREPETTVQIVHGPRAGAVATGDILGSWLADRLGAAVELVAHPEPELAPADDPARVTLRWDGVELESTLADDGGHIVTGLELRDHCLLPTRCPASRAPLGDLLAAAVDHAGPA